MGFKEKLGPFGIAICGGILWLHGDGRETLDQWLEPINPAGVSIRQASDAVLPEHASEREPEGQMLRMARATQVATSSAMIYFGAPESPAR
jgi:hypothetical protein